MKRILLSVALAVPLTGFAAGGVIDGAYECAVGPLTGAIAVVGYPDGRAAFGVVALEEYQELNGYGLGQVVGATFSGTTNSGGSFNLTISGTTLTGTAQLRVGGQMTTVNASCNKIY